MKQLTNKQRIKLAKLQHYKWLKSLGLNVDMNTGRIIKRFKTENNDLDLSHLKVKDSIPCGNRIEGDTYRRYYSTSLPAGKTISVAYNKGPYQVVDAKDFKTMGRKI